MAEASVNVLDSILQSTKKLLGIESEYDHFDSELILNINAALMTLDQLGVTPKGFSISSKEDTWDELLGGRDDLEGTKTYIYLKTKLAFDPPQMGYLVDAIKVQISELEWRLLVQAEGGGE